MNNFKSMKFEVTAEQPLEEIVRELERLRYTSEFEVYKSSKIICTFDDGVFVDYLDEKTDDSFILTTLAELKNMKCFDH